MFCPSCRQEQPSTHHFCVRCGVLLPGELLAETAAKASRFFAGVKVHPADPEQGFLRVTCYRKDQTFESEEGTVTIPGHHVRFSLWVDNEARCVISVPESEAQALAAFIASELVRLNGDDHAPSIA